MDKETELAYLKAVAASSQDVVNVLETIAAQFKSMEEATTRLHLELCSLPRYGPSIRELVHRVRSGNQTDNGRHHRDRRSQEKGFPLIPLEVNSIHLYPIQRCVVGKQTNDSHGTKL